MHSKKLSREDINVLKGKAVEITNHHGSVYRGVVGGTRPGKFVLTSIQIVNSEGGVTVPKNRNTRWFAIDKFTIAQIG